MCHFQNTTVKRSVQDDLKPQVIASTQLRGKIMHDDRLIANARRSFSPRPTPKSHRITEHVSTLTSASA
jgi:hypothetical protein